MENRNDITYLLNEILIELREQRKENREYNERILGKLNGLVNKIEASSINHSRSNKAEQSNESGYVQGVYTVCPNGEEMSVPDTPENREMERQYAEIAQIDAEQEQWIKEMAEVYASLEEKEKKYVNSLPNIEQTEYFDRLIQERRKDRGEQ